MRLTPVMMVMGVYALGAATLACEKVTNLDVGYSDASAEGGDGGEGGPAPSMQEFEGCPCDETQGLGCCVPKTGTPYCTINLDECNSDHGVYLKCVREDINSESVCCWHQGTGGAGSLTALASSCDGGVPACLSKDECGGGPCTTVVCGGVTMGACGTTPPACP